FQRKAPSKGTPQTGASSVRAHNAALVRNRQATARAWLCRRAIFVSSCGTQRRMWRDERCTDWALGRHPSWARNARRFQIVQQRPGVFQVGGIESFREPVEYLGV